jgi:hypothetical protein
MTRHPSRLALAIFDRFIPDNDALRGDLIEEFHVRASQLWLWRQVVFAVVWRSWQPMRWRRLDPQMLTLGAAVLVLLSFEAVLVINVMRRLLFGPALPNVSGYLYYLRLQQLGITEWQPVPAAGSTGAMFAMLVALVSMPAGWLIAGFHRAHHALSLVAFSACVLLCVMLNLQASFVVQFFAALIFIIGLIGGASLNPATATSR